MLYATTKPAAMMPSSTPVVHHTNGVQNQRAAAALVGLTGNFDVPGGNVSQPPSWLEVGGAGFATREHAVQDAAQVERPAASPRGRALPGLDRDDRPGPGHGHPPPDHHRRSLSAARPGGLRHELPHVPRLARAGWRRSRSWTSSASSTCSSPTPPSTPTSCCRPAARWSGARCAATRRSTSSSPSRSSSRSASPAPTPTSSSASPRSWGSTTRTTTEPPAPRQPSSGGFLPNGAPDFGAAFDAALDWILQPSGMTDGRTQEASRRACRCRTPSPSTFKKYEKNGFPTPSGKMEFVSSLLGEVLRPPGHRRPPRLPRAQAQPGLHARRRRRLSAGARHRHAAAHVHPLAHVPAALDPQPAPRRHGRPQPGRRRAATASPRATRSSSPPPRAPSR